MLTHKPSFGLFFPSLRLSFLIYNMGIIVSTSKLIARVTYVKVPAA